MKLKELTDSLDFNNINLEHRIGFNTEFIGQLVKIRRNNVSKELNELVHEGKVIKLRGKPVLYLDRYSFENKTNIKINRLVIDNNKSLQESTNKYQNIDYIKNQTKNSNNRKSNSFKIESISIIDRFIGSKDSLKTQVEQAKAAILYPPKGLHTLIVGDTGVGKTTFVEAMYKYAVDSKIMSNDIPFVVFNCADYSDNPQLLVSQLFGHIKGAFTGADKEKKGLIDYANKGILFLDEVHRLPPEGQEMMFLLIDKGTYRRLGESENTHNANLLIIAATTENPHSTMLPTFIRRIPMFIKLPNLEERTLKERMELICEFLKNESCRVKVPIKVSKEVLKALMAYDCPGNIGQLKSDIQLICARAFLDYTTYNSKIIEVKLVHISQKVREGFFKISKRSEELSEYFNLSEIQDIIFDGLNTNIQNNVFTNSYKKEEDFYEIILNNWSEFSKLGYSTNDIRKKIDNQIEEYFNKVLPSEKYINNNINKKSMLKIVSEDVLRAVEEALEHIKENYNTVINQKTLFGLSLHIQTLLKRLKSGQVISHPDKESVITGYNEDYEAAKEVKKVLEKRLLINIPEDEVAFLTMYLHALKIAKNEKNVGVLVIAHGHATASSMSQVANSLLGVNHTKSIDMLLEEKVEAVLERAVEKVKLIDEGKGVLILTDMGSLTTFSQIITEKTGIPTRTIDMASTLLVIEATRKALIPNMKLDILFEDLKKSMSSFVKSKSEYNSSINVNSYELRYLETVLEDILDKTLTFLNPRKVCKMLVQTLQNILSDLCKEMDEDIKVKFLFHCSCMIERAIKNDPISYDGLEELKYNKKELFRIIIQNFKLVYEVFDIIIEDTEIAYVVEIFDAHYNTHYNTHCNTLK